MVAGIRVSDNQGRGETESDKRNQTRPFGFLSIVCLWLDVGLPCPQVLWCHWREIAQFSATPAQNRLAVWSARERSLEILRHDWVLNQGHKDDRQWDTCNFHRAIMTGWLIYLIPNLDSWLLEVGRISLIWICVLFGLKYWKGRNGAGNVYLYTSLVHVNRTSKDNALLVRDYKHSVSKSFQPKARVFLS